MSSTSGRRVALVTLGCARNEVDSEELAGRLAADGWELVARGRGRRRRARQHLRLRRGGEEGLDRHPARGRGPQGRRAHAGGGRGRAASPSATASSSPRRCPRPTRCSGFDDYADISARLRHASWTASAHVPHAPRDRRTLLPLAPADRAARRPHPRSPATPTCPTAWLPPPGRSRCGAARRRAGGRAQAGVRLRPALHVLRDPDLPRVRSCRGARRRARRGRAGWPSRACASSSWSARTPRRTARTSATSGCSRRCCPSWPRSTGIDRVRVSYLQPAEMRPGLIEVMTSTPGVAPYFDLSFQHASGPVLRRMRRFGDTERFLELVAAVRAASPDGRHPVQRHRRVPRRDRGRPRRARALPGRCAGSTPSASSATPTRTAPRPPRSTASSTRTSCATASSASPRLADELVAQRAEERIGETVEVLVESVDAGRRHRRGPGRAPGPEVDGSTTLLGRSADWRSGRSCARRVVATEGADLVAEVTEPSRGPRDRSAAVSRPVSAWNIANALTVLRLVLVPVFLVAAAPRRRRGRRVAGRWPARRSPWRRSPTGSTARSPGGAGWSPTSARSPTRSPTRR